MTELVRIIRAFLVNDPAPVGAASRSGCAANDAKQFDGSLFSAGKYRNRYRYNLWCAALVVLAASTSCGQSSGEGTVGDSAGRDSSGGDTSGGGSTGGDTSGGGSAGGDTSGGGSTGGDTSGGGGSTGAEDSGKANSTLAPTEGALLGAYVSGDLAEFEQSIGRRVAVVHKFWAWKDDFLPFVEDQIRAQRLAQVTWEAWQGGVGTELDRIVDGSFDEMIRTRARKAQQLGQPFFLRWGHEMNGNWYPWDGTHNGSSEGGAEKYIAAYRHLHDAFVSEGATNVLWVFCPNVDSVPNEAWNAWTQYYPGDEYVDWLCFDGYNWGTTQDWGSTWQEFPEIVSRIYESLAAKGKPILIGEMASTESGGDKAAWIAGIVPALRRDYPQIKGLSWFNTNKETDWRAESSEASLAAFRSMASDPWFNP